MLQWSHSLKYHWQVISQFFDAGGWVLYPLSAVAFIMWWLLLDRVLFLWKEYPVLSKKLARPMSYTQFLSERCDVALSLGRYVPLIKTLIALCPLLGLLGTVSGMVEVFEVLAQNGTGNARLISAGIARTTMPTMAGMVIAVLGLLSFYRIQTLIVSAQQRLQVLSPVELDLKEKKA